MSDRFFKSDNKAVKRYVLISLLWLVIQVSYASDQDFATIMAKINAIKDKNNVSAAVVIVVDKHNTLINQKLGFSSWEKRQPLTKDSMFRIGSISKSFAGLLALRMQAAGVIDLKKSITEYLKESPIHNLYPGNPITVEQLLEHTAGLPDLSKNEWDYNASKPINIEQALKLRTKPYQTNWPSGMHASYSNGGTGLLGLVLEKASGHSYEQLMADYVFKPLSMHSSTLLLEPHVKKRLIKGYNTDGTTLIPYWHNIYRPFAAINTDDSDMIQFLQMLLHRGQVDDQVFLTEKAMQRMESPKTTLAARSGLSYGYGLGNYSWQYEGHTFHGHGGDADGYLSRYGYNKSSGLAYFVMINAFQHHTLKSMRNVLEEHITKKLPKPQYPTRLQLTDEQLKRYVGEYHSATQRFGNLSKKADPELKIFIENQQLYRQFNGRRPQVLYAVTNNHFRHFDESQATVAFVKHNQKYYLQADFGNFVKLD